jgi:hypothetical protein
MREIGSTGLRIFGNQISEEFLKQLAGLKGIKVYAEMRDNDPTIGAIFFVIEKLLRRVKWKSTPASNEAFAVEAADFLTECMGDMEHSWEDMISEILSMLTFGFAPLETVYKVRGGVKESNPSYHSKFNDGKIGWRKLPLRAQETIWQWIFDTDPNSNTYGDLVAIEQLPPIGTKVKIPMDKVLLFRTQSYKNSPMGRSILRNSYRSWLFKKRIEEIEGIGIERDLAGLVVIKVPASLLAEDATPEEKATLLSLKALATNIRRDEQEGVIFPLVYDADGNELYKLELLSTGGQRQFDTSQIVDRYDKRIAMTVVADFIFLGQSKVGSFALSSDKTDLFAISLGAWLDGIASVFNKKAIPQLMMVNDIEPEYWPTLVPGDIEKAEMSKFIDAIYKLVGVGALIPDKTVETKIREVLDIPSDPEEEITPMDFIEQRIEAGNLAATNGNVNNNNPGGGDKTVQGKPGKGQKRTSGSTKIGAVKRHVR